MKLVPKTDLFDLTFPTRRIFTKGEAYEVEDTYNLDGVIQYIVTDNQRYRNYISVTGTFIDNFLVG